MPERASSCSAQLPSWGFSSWSECGTPHSSSRLIPKDFTPVFEAPVQSRGMSVVFFENDCEHTVRSGIFTFFFFFLCQGPPKFERNSLPKILKD